MRRLLGIFFLFFILLVFPSSVSAQVVVNEFLPNPSSGNDWVELYSEVDTDISNWILDDDGTSTDMAILPIGTTIGPSTNKYYSIEVGTRLNQANDVLSLYKADRSLVDSKSYDQDPGLDISFGRFPDGQSWGTCSPTKYTSNTTCQFPTSIPSPTQTSTPTPTQSPTPTPTKSPTPVPTQSPTPKSSKSPSPSPEVLGEETTPTPESEKTSPTPLVSDSTKKKFPFVPVLFIGSGLALIGFAAVQLMNAKKSAQET